MDHFIARFVAFFHMSIVWFNCTEPSLYTSLKGMRDERGACAHLLISAIMWSGKVWEGSLDLNYPELLIKHSLLPEGSVKSNHPELMFKNSTHPAHLLSPLKMYLGRIGNVKPPRTLVKELVISAIMQGSRNFDALDLPQISAYACCTLCLSC